VRAAGAGGGRWRLALLRGPGCARRRIAPAGAGGPHFCLGANLARREITVMFDEIRRRLPNLHVTGEPEWLQSAFINGIKHIQCAW
jgi:cytochrome P450